MSSAIPQWLQDMGTIVSILGFILTFLVFRQVSEVRRSFMRRARLPDHIKSLRKYASELNSAITNNAGVATLATEVNSAEHVIKKIRPLLSPECRKDAKNILKQLNGKRSSISIEAINIYSSLQVFIRVLESEIKDMRWE